MRRLLLALLALLLLPLLIFSRPADAQSGQEAWRIHTHVDDIYGLAVDGSVVWAATGGGVVRWDTATGTPTVFTIDDGLPSGQARSIAYDPATGYVWVGTLGGLARWDGARWTAWTTAQGLGANNVDGVAIDGAGRVWATNSFKVSVLEGNTFHNFSSMEYAIPAYYGDVIRSTVPTRVWAIEDGGKVWTTVFPGDGVHLYDGTRWTTYPEGNPPNFPSSQVVAVAITQTGVRWFGALNTVVRWSQTRPATSVGAGIVPRGEVSSVTTDEQGRVWLGAHVCDDSCSGGMARVDDRGTDTESDDIWNVYVARSGELPSPVARALARGENGTMWIGTAAGLARVNANDTWGPTLRVGGLPSNQVNVVYRDSFSRVWVGTDRGLAMLEGTVWTVYNGASGAGLPSDNVHDIVQVGPDIWVATGENRANGPVGGISRLSENGTWRHFGIDGLGSTGGNVQALAVDTAGRVWAGTSGADNAPPRLVVYLAEGQWVTWVSGADATFGSINDIATRLNKVWLATAPDGVRGGGLTVLDHGGSPSTLNSNWTTYTSLNTSGGLPSDFVTSVAVDAARVWVGTPLGLGRLDLQPNTWRAYTQANTGGGLINNFINSVSLVGSGSQVWAMTQGGASRLDTLCEITPGCNAWRSWARPDGVSHNIYTSSAPALSCGRWLGSTEGLARLVWDECALVGPTPTPFPSRTPTYTPTLPPTATLTPTATQPPTGTPLPSPTPSRTATVTPTLLLPPTRTPTLTLTLTVTTPPTGTATPTETLAPGVNTPTVSVPTASLTLTPTATPPAPTISPTPDGHRPFQLFLPLIARGVKGPPPVG